MYRQGEGAQLAPSSASSCIFKLPAPAAAPPAAPSPPPSPAVPLATSGFRLVVFRSCYLCRVSRAPSSLASAAALQLVLPLSPAIFCQHSFPFSFCQHFRSLPYELQAMRLLHVNEVLPYILSISFSLPPSLLPLLSPSLSVSVN